MEATLPIIHELTAAGDSVMWIVGPGDMVSENYSRGIREPRVHGKYITISAHNWRFHLEPEMVRTIEFVETHGDLKSHYVRFADQDGETLLRAYLPRPRQDDAGGAPREGNPRFEGMRERYAAMQGVESVLREVRSSAAR
jgi:putative heme iron utilization protein